jgi:hypothetical protein
LFQVARERDLAGQADMAGVEDAGQADRGEPLSPDAGRQLVGDRDRQVDLTTREELTDCSKLHGHDHQAELRRLLLESAQERR